MHCRLKNTKEQRLLL